ncbi:hypothetical protein [Pareuzebyella sediminis]|uniref:hypothetical protein n=1 Tax=Pareuzebyella sediminis TaxID=2607998 RepID=UPI0011ED3CAE|nr:hypothetical protein [Pareuzebyella sediminis]
MKTCIKKFILPTVFGGLLLLSCSEEEDFAPKINSDGVPEATEAKAQSIDLLTTSRFDLDALGITVKDFETEINTEAVAPSECGETPFDAVANYYNDALINGFISAWDGNPEAIQIILGDYFVINQIAAFEGVNTDYFGENGEYTNYMRKSTRSLEKFWNMPDQISVRGQHTKTLLNLEFMRYVYKNYSLPPLTDEEIDGILAIAQHFNTASDQIPENPFYASDGFATFGQIIVIGDGIVTLLEDTGLDPKVVWSSILAHEWGHQIQFLNYGVWEYPLPAFPEENDAASTRMTELEADFITGYYLTHKRGATYNWKRVEDFLTAFYNIGDCGFDSPGHHGTPLQRLKAARKGYELAQSGQKKGQILSQQEVHDAFIAEFTNILNASMAETVAR